MRLRLTRSEVASFGQTGAVEEAIEFGPGRSLRYRIESSAVLAEISADFEDAVVRVSIPRGLAVSWSGSELVGLSGEQSLPDGAVLKILVEKDFACLQPVNGEDQSDAFPNPGGAAC